MDYREGLKQRKWVNYLAIYVVLGFVATELSLFLICRPLSNYWAVPTPDCQFPAPVSSPGETE